MVLAPGHAHLFAIKIQLTLTAFWLKNRDSARCCRRVTQPPHIAGPLGAIIYNGNFVFRHHFCALNFMKQSKIKSGGLLIICFLALFLSLSCEKKSDLITLHFTETACGNPWNLSADDPDYLENVKEYLEQQGLTINYISLSLDGPISFCFSCLCPTGRRINIITNESDKDL